MVRFSLDRTGPTTPTSIETAAILREIGGFLRFDPAASFKARAYERAALTVEVVPDLARLARPDS